ncbi:MAG: ferrous iron transport protein B [Bacteroidales bacterium]|nr:ferrous iron transport protein B [Bacteroidales bacterium]
MTSLRDLGIGETGIITKVRGRGAFRKRITEMGFIKGKEVTVIRSAPLKDPIDYKVMGYEVSLRRSEAELIEVVTPGEVPENLINTRFEGVIDADPLANIANEKGKIIDVAMIGNPNSGKTTLFNIASHSRQMTGNYGGVTVDSKLARFNLDGYTFNITDLPGTYSVSHYTPEELFVREHIREKMPDIVVNVIDASNLERNLYLTTQLIDMDIRVVVALNMHDEMLGKGDIFDFEALGKMLGIPFVPTIGTKKKGINELFRKVIDVFEDKDPDVRHIHINYGQDIEHAIDHLQAIIKKDTSVPYPAAPRYYALKLLEKDDSVTSVLEKKANYAEIRHDADREIKKLENLHREDTETLITDARYGFIGGALKETFKAGKKEKGRRSRFVDRYITSKYLSYPIFFLFMWIMFEATFLIGSYPMEWISRLVDITGSELTAIMPEGMIRDLLVNGVIGGVGGVIVFLPNILILFLFISLMEDTGYMARVAFIVDRIMHKVGLHGRSFIPLLMGFGCNVPAIMATRTIESRSDRLVTMFITPLMSCSARYPVYVLIISAFFTKYQGTILFGIYIIGIILAALVAVILKKTIFRSSETPFVMELPPYRIPTVRNILRHTWNKGSQYLKKMGGIILLASLLIWLLGYFPRNEEKLSHFNMQSQDISNNYDARIASNPEDSDMSIRLSEEKTMALDSVNRLKEGKRQEYSFIGIIGRFIEPVMRPLGFDWKMTVSLIAGAAAKEIVVSTMGVLYEVGESGQDVSLISKIREQEYTAGPRMGEKVFTPIAALAFMIFVLIYFPCIAVIAAIKKESGSWKWAIFVAGYTTGLAWVAAFAVYQIGSLLM